MPSACFAKISANTITAAQPRLSLRIASGILFFKAFQSMAAQTVVEKETRTEEALDVPWNVVVHNDPVNLMSYVTMVFQRVFGYSKERAQRHMLEVHQKGRSIVWSGMREPAELYVQQLHSYLLLATIERTE